MTFWFRVRLQTTPKQDEQLLALQRAFIDACNALAPLAQETRVWSRVGLHQLGYRRMRKLFPELGSQMICSAIYSVSRACRLVYQNADSPFNVQRVGSARLPVLRFSPDAPVYFDRHTLSVRSGKASMFTLDGRIRFNLPLAAEDEQRFREARLLEIMLMRGPDGLALIFTFADETASTGAANESRTAKQSPKRLSSTTAQAVVDGVVFESTHKPAADKSQFPEYLLVIDPQGGALVPAAAVTARPQPAAADDCSPPAASAPT